MESQIHWIKEKILGNESYLCTQVKYFLCLSNRDLNEFLFSLMAQGDIKIPLWKVRDGNINITKWNLRKRHK